MTLLKCCVFGTDSENEKLQICSTPRLTDIQLCERIQYLCLQHSILTHNSTLLLYSRTPEHSCSLQFCPLHMGVATSMVWVSPSEFLGASANGQFFHGLSERRKILGVGKMGFQAYPGVRTGLFRPPHGGGGPMRQEYGQAVYSARYWVYLPRPSVRHFHHIRH